MCQSTDIEMIFAPFMHADVRCFMLPCINLWQNGDYWDCDIINDVGNG